MSPDEKSLRAKLAAHASWANTDDPTERTSNARAAFLDSFEEQVDPEGTLAPEERARKAEHLRKAYFLDLALKSAKARRANKEARKQAASAAELHAIVDEITGGAA